MSAQHVKEVFSVERHLPECSKLTEAVIQRQLRIIFGDDLQKMELESIAPFSSVDVNEVNLEQLGEYLGRVAITFSQLTTGLCDYLSEAEEDKYLELVHGRHLNILPGPPSSSLQRLSRIADISARFERELKNAWTLSGDDHLVQTPSEGSENHYQIANFSRSVTDDSLPQPKPSPRASSCGSGDLSSDLLKSINREELKKRGRGSYWCPFAEKCTKGGAGVEYVRNSAFLAHLQKHEKIYECQDPDCPNPPEKRRFARPDGLKRHLDHVHAENYDPSRQRGKGKDRAA